MSFINKIRDKSGYFIGILGAILIVQGIFNGEISVVYAKAMRICLECIGIG
ncbi:MAG: CD1871A family CXXC motif-containing protein [Lachnospirales bacterium]